VSQLADIRIVASPRIHLGLISMHSNAPRRNGGVGFSIIDPAVAIEIRAGHPFSIKDDRPYPFSASELSDLANVVQAALIQNGISTAAMATISGSMRTHVGMGSGTAIRLGIIEAMHLSQSATLSWSELIETSRRGGTSGIGTATYSSGGMVLDLGSPNDNGPMIPSSQAIRGRAPSTLPSIAMPDWPLCICLPNAIRPKTEDEEVDFFARVTPLSAAASYRASYEALFGVYASVKDRDYDGFCRAVNLMQETEWKQLEWREYGKPLQILRDGLVRCGADCVGMSSLGPMLFCFGTSRVLERIAHEEERLDCTVRLTRPNNRGRHVSWPLQCES
jgi:beta-ribofuranosylaminobenzene 5'-phosphate synthase